ncbi:unnamed protein product [Merluccius merluccius]
MRSSVYSEWGQSEDHEVGEKMKRFNKSPIGSWHGAQRTTITGATAAISEPPASAVITAAITAAMRSRHLIPICPSTPLSLVIVWQLPVTTGAA